MIPNYTAEQQPDANQIAWRRFWLANVTIDTGKPLPPQIPRHKVPARKLSPSRRLHRLRCVRAMLGPP